MTSEEVRKKFLDFFAKNGHEITPSSSLIPDDPSVLLTTAGMQQFKKYYAGELDPLKDIHPNLGRPLGSLNAVSIQKSFRTSDIDEVGDERHLTFFEMMGNFSFGGYFKKEAIEYAHKFLTQELGLDISFVTVFEGSDSVPKDEESKEIWRRLGVSDIREEGMKDVFWGPTGGSGPCGPTTEIYCKNGAGEDIEIWNIVFNEYMCSGSRKELENGEANLTPLAIKGIDTGMGLERLMMVLQKTPTVFETDLFAPIISKLNTDLPNRVKRIIADHIRATAFLISDGIRPSNKEAGYILRRLMRRVITHASKENITSPPEKLLEAVIEKYKDIPDYRNLNFSVANSVYADEYLKFIQMVGAGLKKLEQFLDGGKNHSNAALGETAFDLYQSFGLPVDAYIDELHKRKVSFSLDSLKRFFEEALQNHQEVSRAGLEKKFGGHGLILDTGELKAGSEEELKKVIRLHTATHLLHNALREVLGESVHQTGSDITPERTRFDFSFERKLTDEEKQKVQAIVNDNIKKSLTVNFEEMPKDEAEKTGALHFFKEKYPDRVKVYYIGDSLENAVSKEFCGGPHTKNTGEIGNFKIIKEEAVGVGVRRVRGMIE